MASCQEREVENKLQLSKDWRLGFGTGSAQ